MTELLTTGQVQDILKVDRTTIYRMVENGRLPGIRVGKQWRFQRVEIEQWLQARNTQREMPEQRDNVAPNTARVAPRSSELREALPLACVQLIQDAFAEMTGVMMIVTDMHGRPITQLSNGCGLYQMLMRRRDATHLYTISWQHLAANASLEPRFFTDEVGLLCARGLIHLDQAMAGMVIIGGIAPEAWPPSAEHTAQVAAAFQVSQVDVNAHLHEVFHLAKVDQDKALRCAQRIADIFSHIAKDRSVICGKLHAIASLTAL